MKPLPPVAILAGGLGTRLRPFTERFPKALVPVNGRPFIDHQLDLLASRGIERVVLCVSYLGELIEAHVGDGTSYGLKVSYSHDGATRLGTAGALKRAIPLLGGAFFCLYGDSYLRCDYAGVFDAYKKSGKRGLMTVYRNQNRLVASNVVARDGRIIRYDKEHPDSEMQHVDFGLSVLSVSSLEWVQEEAIVDLSAVFHVLLGDEQLAAYESPTRFYEVGSAAGLADLEAFLLRSGADG